MLVTVCIQLCCRIACCMNVLYSCCCTDVEEFMLADRCCSGVVVCFRKQRLRLRVQNNTVRTGMWSIRPKLGAVANMYYHVA